MKTDDRRVRKTRMALQEALVELLLDTELRNITVRELTDKADIHRATFYAHYKDIYDLYEQMEDFVIGDLSKIIVSDPTHTYDEHFKIIIGYVYENGKICRMLLNKNGTMSFYDRISSFLEERYLEIWQYETKQESITQEIRFLIRYHIQGCLSIVTKWAEGNYLYPQEKIAKIIYRLDANFDQIIY